MSWIVDHVSRREFGDGEYEAHEWTLFLEEYGLELIELHLPDAVSALIIDDTIVLNEALSGADRDFHAWHEIGHWALHVGDRRFLRRSPCGHLIISKQERQATEFALRYPVWDPGTAEQLARERGIFCGETR